VKPNRVAKWLLLGAAWLSLVVVPQPAANADDTAAVNAAVKKGLVSILMTATDEDKKPTSEGSGFLITKDGYILTSYYLLSKLQSQMTKRTDGPVDIRISIGEKKPVRDRQAFIVDASPYLDVLLLKTPSADRDYPFLNLGTSETLELASDDVFAAGFALNSGYSVVKTTITGKDGLVWPFQNNVDEGLSGGPVHRANGEVVGIVRSVASKLDFGFVPIDMGGEIVSRIKLRDLEEKLDSRINGQVQKFITGQQGKDTLAALFRDNLPDRNKALAPTSDPQAYSFSITGFSLSLDGGTKFYNWPFHKDDTDQGQLFCQATYPDGKIPNKINFRFNDQATNESFGPPNAGKNIAYKLKVIRDNRSLVDPVGVSKGLVPKADQQISFFLEDVPSFKGTIEVLCTIVVIDSSKLTQSGQ
jgi:Trypsin-like peptidase domain